MPSAAKDMMVSIFPFLDSSYIMTNMLSHLV
jgi:hypothetical protein